VWRSKTAQTLLNEICVFVEVFVLLALECDAAQCQEQEQDLVTIASSNLAQPPGTLFHLTFTTLLTPVHSENDSRIYFLIVLITD